MAGRSSWHTLVQDLADRGVLARGEAATHRLRHVLTKALISRGGPVEPDVLVQQMTSQGLRFAPCITRGEPAYTALHQALVTYTLSMNQIAAR